MPRYFVFYKPYGVLSQFTAEVEGQRTLAEFGFPPEVYPVGRLDRDSEGLLLLTDDKRLNHRLLNPAFRHRRTYLAQVEGLPDTEALERLRRGVGIRVGKKPYTT
ncbi:MAG: pseudouridine synthase, partial [Bacteroidetes bacterium]